MRDLTAVRRAKAVFLPMLFVPALLLVVLPFAIGLAARSVGSVDVTPFLDRLPADLAAPIVTRPPAEQMILLVNGYLLAPLVLIQALLPAGKNDNGGAAGKELAGEREPNSAGPSGNQGKFAIERFHG